MIAAQIVPTLEVRLKTNAFGIMVCLNPFSSDPHIQLSCSWC